jgi:hypothetical protein
MPLVGFERTIAVFESANKFHVLDREATGDGQLQKINNSENIVSPLYCQINILSYTAP